MGTYYCHHCASELGCIGQLPQGKFVASQYQLDKYVKHTIPSGRFLVQSVFDTPSTQAYRTFALDALAGGAVEVDDAGRTNILWVAGRQTGFRFEHGRLVQPTDAVKVLLSSNSTLVHTYPDNSTSFAAAVCARCGAQIVC